MSARGDEPPATQDPGSETAPRRSLLRRAWIAWVVALVLVGASAGGIAWLRSERDALRAETAAARERLGELRSDLERRKASIEQERETETRLADALRVCVRVVREGQAVASAWIDHLAAARDREFDRAEELAERINPLRGKANRSLRRCEDKVREEGIL